MLPYLVHGLTEADFTRAQNFSDWYTKQLERPEIAEVRNRAPQRAKRQTIRPRHDDRRSPWATAKPGAVLQIWWKQRAAAERFFLGTVPMKSVALIAYGPSTKFYRGADSTHADQVPEPWYEDGFENLHGFRDYFLPEAAKGANGVFQGWEIKW